MKIFFYFVLIIYNIKDYILNQIVEDCFYFYIWMLLSVNVMMLFFVMVYIYGGNFVYMSVDLELFDVEEFVYKG